MRGTASRRACFIIYQIFFSTLDFFLVSNLFFFKETSLISFPHFIFETAFTYVCIHAPRFMWESQRTTYKTQIFPAIWILEIWLRLSGSEVSTFTPWPSHSSPSSISHGQSIHASPRMITASSIIIWPHYGRTEQVQLSFSPRSTKSNFAKFQTPDLIPKVLDDRSSTAFVPFFSACEDKLVHSFLSFSFLSSPLFSSLPPSLSLCL